MTLAEFESALKQLPCKVFHYTGSHRDQYIVWQEYGLNSLRGGYGIAEKAQKVQIDIYSKQYIKSGYEIVLEQLMQLLDDIDAAYDDPIITYEPDTEFIHVIVDCEVL